MLKVLIAEDDLLIADMAEEVLITNGYEVCGIGRNVADALALARQHNPDLAVLDVRLANGDLGTAIAAELADRRRLGILYVTGNAAAVTRTPVHGHACLAKPYRIGELLRSLEIVSELIDTGSASPPFPANFQILPAAGTRDSARPDDDAARTPVLRRQQSVLSRFGSFALRQDNLPAVLMEAVRASAEGIQAPYCKVYRYRSMQDDLVREASYGWHAGIAVHAILHADARSPEGRSFVTRGPVICNDVSNRINSDPQIVRRAVSTVDVIIKGEHGRPYGVLGASNNSQQDYDQSDAEFLGGIAKIVAQSVSSFERVRNPGPTTERLPVRAEAGNALPHREKILGGGLLPGTSGGRPPANRQTGKPMTDTAGKAKMLDAGMTAYSALPRTMVAADPRRRTTASAVSRPVLIVEDDADLREILVEHFAGEVGFTVCTAATLAEADDVLADSNHYFDAILLDVGLPDGDGCDYCAALRRRRYDMPIIMLTAANEEMDVVRGLDCGANDYVGKPFAWNALFARLRGQLRLFEDSESAVFAIGPYLFRPAKKVLEDRVRNRRILLTNMEATVLKFLYRWGPGVVERNVLAKEVWGHNSRVTTHTLETHMYRLRQKMEINPHVPDLLLTDQGGYRLNFGMASS